jgi:hypothetical protein
MATLAQVQDGEASISESAITDRFDAAAIRPAMG